MKIEAHLLHWQEIDIMPFVIKHYTRVADDIIIHDNHSKDGSVELAKELGCIVIPFGTDFFDDDINKDLKNECWRGSNADFVIVSDFDELLFCTDPCLKNVRYWLEYFKEEENPSIIKTIGWNVMSDDWPANELTEITNGYRFDNYSKNILFDPKRIQEINYGPGAHECNPVGDVVWSNESLYLMHYKHIGGAQRTIDRCKVLSKRTSKNNRKKGYGIHNHRTPASLRQEWNQRMAISKPLI